MPTVYPPLTAEDFETQYDNEHRYMFIEPEDGDMFYTYGHDRDDEFASQVVPYVLGGDLFCIIGIHSADEDTPGAFPVSVIFR